jgi:flagellar biosynthesis/type III secretory pathway protein FliH
MPIYKWNKVKDIGTMVSADGGTLEQSDQVVPRDPTAVDLAAIEKMKEDARVEINEMKRAAMEDEIEPLRKKAYDEGYAQGQSEVSQKTQANLKKSFEAIQESLDQRKDIIKTAEPEILKLAVKIAVQLINSEITLNRGVILNVVSDAINKITDREQVIIKVNINDLAQVKDFKDDIEDMLDGAKNLSIVSDKKVESGGCIIETKVGLVDARISTKVGAIESAFLKVYTEDLKKEAEGKGEKLSYKEMQKITGETPEELAGEEKLDEDTDYEDSEDESAEDIEEDYDELDEDESETSEVEDSGAEELTFEEDDEEAHEPENEGAEEESAADLDEPVENSADNEDIDDLEFEDDDLDLDLDIEEEQEG